MIARLRVFLVPLLIVVGVIVYSEVSPVEGWSYVALLAGIFSWPFVYVPIAVRPRMARPIAPPIVYFDPAVHTLPLWAHAFMRDVAIALSSQGFTVQNALVGIVKPNVSAWTAVLENPTSGDVALLMATWTNIGFGASYGFVAFRSRFADGSEVVTVNHPRPSLAEETPPNRKTLRMPAARDPIALYHLHQTLAASVGAPREALSCNGDPIAFQRAESIASAEHLVAIGRYRRDERRGLYLPTWRAAIAFAWRNTFPISLVTRARLGWQRRAILRDLGAAEV